MNCNFKNISLIAEAIREPATRGCYDWLLLGISTIGAIISVFALYLTYKIYNRQIALMEQQNAIVQKQVELIEQQNKIADDQLEASRVANAIANKNKL